MNAKVGDTITIRGRNFIRGKNKNTVVFKRDGARAVFAKETLGTAQADPRRGARRAARVPDARAQPTRVRLRVLSERFGKKFTAASKSPTHRAAAAAAGRRLDAPTGPDRHRHDARRRLDGRPGAAGRASAPVTRTATGWPTSLENDLGLDACKADTDGDGVPDGYEYQSARDLNDDEYQEANNYLPTRASGRTRTRSTPTPTTTTTATACRWTHEYRLWKALRRIRAGGLLPRDATACYYSDGEQYSLSTPRGGTGRRAPTPARRRATPRRTTFLDWAADQRLQPGPHPQAVLRPAATGTTRASAFDIRDVNHSGAVPASEATARSTPTTRLYDRDCDTYSPTTSATRTPTA